MMLKRVMSAALLAGTIVLAAGCKSANQEYREQGEVLFAQARAAEDAKDDAKADDAYAQAKIAFNKSIAEKSTDPVSNSYLAAIHYRATEYEMAAYFAQVSLQFDPSNSLARVVMIRARIKQDKPDLALDALERLSALADKTKDPRPDISNIKVQDRKKTELNLYFSPVNNRYEIGRVYESLGDLDNAALWYRNALSVRGDDVTVLLALVKLHEKSKNRANLISAIQRTYAVDPANAELLAVMSRNGISISQITGPK